MATPPILEFDADPTAFIEPRTLIRRREGLPAAVVACFFQDVITTLVARHAAKVIWHLRSEIGTFPVYEFLFEERPFLVFHPGVGAPLAAGYLEEIIALGGERFVACGGAGALRPDLALGHLIVPTSAVRDEGTSYHYLAPGREVAATPAAVASIERTLRRHALPYLLGKTWTTDGLYRETPAKIARRRAEGCATVEMEAAAFFAVARFRGVAFGQILYAGDDLSGDLWDSRDWTNHASVRERLFWLAAEAALGIAIPPAQPPPALP